MALASSNAAQRQARALAAIKKALHKAQQKEQQKFENLYIGMSRKRKTWNHVLSAATTNLNDQLAKQAALKDARFRYTVKRLGAAQQTVARAVVAARKQFT